MKRTRTLIVDDHAPFRTAMEHWLKDFAALEVAGSCATDCSTLPASAGLGVDLLLVGLGTSGQGDFELARRLKADLQARKLVLMSLFPPAEAAAAAVAAGADGLVSKAEIFHALPALLDGFFDAAISRRTARVTEIPI